MSSKFNDNNTTIIADTIIDTMVSMLVLKDLLIKKGVITASEFNSLHFEMMQDFKQFREKLKE